MFFSIDYSSTVPVSEEVLPRGIAREVARAFLKVRTGPYREGQFDYTHGGIDFPSTMKSWSRNKHLSPTDRTRCKNALKMMSPYHRAYLAAFKDDDRPGSSVVYANAFNAAICEQARIMVETGATEEVPAGDRL